jgi:hypothetical protein
LATFLVSSFQATPNTSSPRDTALRGRASRSSAGGGGAHAGGAGDVAGFGGGLDGAQVVAAVGVAEVIHRAAEQVLEGGLLPGFGADAAVGWARRGG